MSTHSRIGQLNQDGSVTSVFCHWDGYPKHQLPILKERYNSPETVTELLKHGDLWALDEYDHKGHKNMPARIDSNVSDYLKNGECFNYLFDGATWTCLERSVLTVLKKV